MTIYFSSLANTGDTIHGNNVYLLDEDDNQIPRGGYAMCGNLDPVGGMLPSMYLRWQDGPVDRERNERPNGTFVEDVLEACRLRLAFYQDSKFACDENARAMSAVETAIEILERRREDRRDRGVEGRNVE